MPSSYRFQRLTLELERGWRWWWTGYGYRVPCLSSKSKRGPKDSNQPNLDEKKNDWTRLSLRWVHKVTDLLLKMWRQVHYELAGERGDETRLKPWFPVLPNEIWVQIMRHLPPGCLWSLRQSSSLFCMLFGSEMAFRPLHAIPGPKDLNVRFNINPLSAAERKDARELLLRDERLVYDVEDRPESYCASCTEVSERGDHPVKIKLWQTRYCDGCKERHFCLFFPPECLEKYDNGALNSLVCIGRLGAVTVCSHELATPLTWNKFEDEVLRHDELSLDCGFELVCKNKCHRPSPKTKQTLYGSACPRLVAAKCRGEYLDLSIGWDRPLLDLDSRYRPTLDDIQGAVANSLEDALLQHRPCRHMQDCRKLRTFAYTGLCRCFCNPAIQLGLARGPWSKDIECSCLRKRYLECRECAATYHWNLRFGRMILSYRYHWHVWRPTSYAWINILGEGPERLGMFTQDNQHLLWCSDPTCATGLRRRWEEMIKEAAWLQQVVYGRQGRDIEYCRDWWVLEDKLRKSKTGRDFCLGGFELAPHLLKSRHDEHNKRLLEYTGMAADPKQRGGKVEARSKVE